MSLRNSFFEVDLSFYSHITKPLFVYETNDYSLTSLYGFVGSDESVGSRATDPQGSGQSTECGYRDHRSLRALRYALRLYLSS